MRLSSINQNVYNYKNNYNNVRQNQSNVTFEGKDGLSISQKLTNNSLFNAIQDKVIKGCVRLVSTKSVQNLVEKTNKIKKLPEKLTSHLIVLGSTLLSGFYVLKTLNNKNMDEEKRKTLAINQGLVYGVSTVMAYCFDGWAFGKIKKLINKFAELNKDADPKMLDKWKKGFGLAKSIMVVDLVYRFIAPVLVTPVANAISNKYIAKKGNSNKV